MIEERISSRHGNFHMLVRAALSSHDSIKSGASVGLSILELVLNFQGHQEILALERLMSFLRSFCYVGVPLRLTKAICVALGLELTIGAWWIHHWVQN